MSGDPAIASPSSRTFGFSERLFVRMLFGVDLFIQEVRSQLLPIINFQLHVWEKKDADKLGKYVPTDTCAKKNNSHCLGYIQLRGQIKLGQI